MLSIATGSRCLKPYVKSRLNPVRHLTPCGACLTNRRGGLSKCAILRDATKGAKMWPSEAPLTSLRVVQIFAPIGLKWMPKMFRRNMFQRTALILFAALLAAPAMAQSVKLKASEIEALLTGKSAITVWDGVETYESFSGEGVVYIVTKEARALTPNWRIDADNDELQISIAGLPDWEGRFVMEYLGTYFWVSKKIPPTPFKVIDGVHTSIPE